MAQSGSKKVVYAALVGNLAIAIFKIIAAILGNSSAMLAEGYHSLSDTINQVLLLIGIHKSTKRPDNKHPYGYGKVQFFYAFLVAVLIFSIAGVLSLREGIHKLLNPEPLHNLTLIFIALAIAFVFESYALYIAYKELREEMKEENIPTLYQAIKESKDPTVLTVVFEDSLALLSIIIASLSIAAAYFLNNPIYDAIGSLVIGTLLMVFAVLLAYETKKLLIGESVTDNKKQEIIRAISSIPQVNDILDLRTMHLGPEQVIITTEVNLNQHLTTKQVEKAIDNIEHNLKKVFPKSICYIEAGGKVACESIKDVQKRTKRKK
ncbi:hypothetical protein A2642_02795 [Candidatus Nomurabacteria bacterium RIFCSPHIGHO2_01_FULL_39_10]|uniref:Uncharacterized protein n=1 Tax=Candidatus Nomurabacteria bacterium RIFCSPHIGHO2_01_FULL_39_10 TaxID=1801733 RepID=A0A1F6V532_9BACT|nr:MAG: hypothetical protein A2642_02795 [Candidatus Nomurabacteria bacterium RIFCSPHIGHO2_01_FULL_39_10]